MTNLSDYIAIYDNAFSEELCQLCLKMFHDDAYPKGAHEAEWRRCREMTLIDQSPQWEVVKAVLRHYYYRYREERKSGVLNYANMLEAPNIFCYQVDTEKPNIFNTHADAWNFPTATRQVSLIVYLNDVAEGGETNFVDLGVKVSPKQGRLLLFPSHFTYMHRGEAPLSGPKYIMVSWIHFDGQGHAYRVHRL